MVCHFRENDKPLYKKRFVTSSRMTKRFFLNVRPFKMEWAHIFCFSIFPMDFCNSSAFGRTVTASGHSNRFAMGRMLSADTFSYGLRSKCADLSEQ